MKSNNQILTLVKRNFSNKLNLISSLSQMSITNINTSGNLPFSHEFLINVNNQINSSSNKRNSLQESIKKSFFNENSCFKDKNLKVNLLNTINFPLNDNERAMEIEEKVKSEEVVCVVDDDNTFINRKKGDLDNESNEKLPSQKYKARNNRIPKQANHGARPCSSVMRKLRLKKILNRGKLKTKDEL